MAKKSAFAFRNFDFERILQRKFFQDLNLPKGLTDKEIFEKLSFSIKTPAGKAGNNLKILEMIADLARKYERKSQKHLQKLQRMDGKKTRKDQIIFYHSEGKGKLSELINRYSKIHEFIGFFSFVVTTEEVEKMRDIMKEIDRKVFGKKLKSVRLSKGFTQKSLAERLGISHSGVVAYENGTREPGLSMLYTIARGLEVPVNSLIE